MLLNIDKLGREAATRTDDQTYPKMNSSFNEVRKEIDQCGKSLEAMSEMSRDRNALKDLKYQHKIVMNFQVFSILCLFA